MVVYLPAQRPAVHAHGRRCTWMYETRNETAQTSVARRLLAWAILHRHSNLAFLMRRMPEPSSPTLDAVAERWFATQ